MATQPYRLAHARVKSRHGAARNWFCAFCGLRADDWALDHSTLDIQRDESDRTYSLDPDSYVPLCTRCHKTYDQHVRQHGTDGLIELFDDLRNAVSSEQRDATRKSVIGSIVSLMRMGYLRPGRDRPFRR
ncbi:hypothetical protein [Streptomyces chartreusis]